MKKIKNIVNIIEIYLPIIFFIIMYSTFLIGVFYRYVLNNPIQWSIELVKITYLWMVLLAVSYTFKRGSHIKFDLIYNLLDKRKRTFLKFAGNIIILFSLILLIKPTISYLYFIKTDRTSIFELRYDFVYLPFLVMLLMMIFRSLEKIITEFRIQKSNNRKEG